MLLLPRGRLAVAYAFALLLWCASAEDNWASKDSLRTATDANTHQAFYATVRLHNLQDGEHQTVTLSPKLAAAATPLQSLERRLPPQFQSRAVLHRLEVEQAADASTREQDDARTDALAEAMEADAWADEFHHGAAMPPDLHFNITSRFLTHVTVLRRNEYIQPFTLWIAHPDDASIVLNTTQLSHGMAEDAVTVALNPPFILDANGVDRSTPFEVVLVFHPRRFSSFETTFTIADLLERRKGRNVLDDEADPEQAATAGDADADTDFVVAIAPANSSMGVEFVVRWMAQLGRVGVWVRRRPPIPDLILEVWLNDGSAGEASHSRGRKLVGHVFTSVAPEGTGFADVVHESDGLHLSENARLHRSLRFTAVVHFAERPREHFSTFEIADLALFVGKMRNRLDGVVLIPSAVDHHTWSASKNLLPVQLLVRFPADSDYLSIELLQPRPVEDVQVWIRDGGNRTLFLEEDAIVHEHVDHWRRDVRHYGFHHAIPATRPVRNNTVRIDVLYNNASTATAASRLFRWMGHHGADVSRIDVVSAPALRAARGKVDAYHPAMVLGGQHLVTKARALAGHTLMRIPSSLMLRSSQAQRVPWIKQLLSSAQYERLESSEAAAPFIGPAAPTGRRAWYRDILHLTLLLLSRHDPPPAHTRWQALYASLQDCHAKSRWASPLMLVSEVTGLLNASLPNYVDGLQAEHRFLEATYQWLNRSAGWLVYHPTQGSKMWTGTSATRRGSNVPYANRESTTVENLAAAQAQITFNAFVDAFTTVASLVVLVRDDTEGAATDRLFIPSLCYALHSDASNSVIEFTGQGDASFRVKPTEARALEAGAPLTFDLASPFISGAEHRLSTFEAYSLLGTVTATVVNAVDMPLGQTLLEDVKSSRDGLLDALCGEDWRAQGPMERRACLQRLKDALAARSADLATSSGQTMRPPRDSPLFARGVQLYQKAPALITGARRAARRHAAWIDHDLAQLDIAVAAAVRRQVAASTSNDDL
jgi:hypothetical protein